MKTFFKFIIKNKLYSIITISGFAISLMFVFILSIYMKKELAVDQFHVNKDRIYRLYRERGSSFGPLIGETIKNELPEVESCTRIGNGIGNATFPGDKKEKITYLLADSSFFTMFSFRLMQGDIHEVLKTKDRVVLTESLALKEFGSENPVGKTIKISDKTFTISGIVKDINLNTHFDKFDVIVPFEVLADFWGYPELMKTNNVSSFGVYFMAKKGTEIRNKEQLIKEQFKKDYWLYKDGFAKELKFEPLTEVYLSNSTGPAIRTNSINTIAVYGATALLILLISIINYINLTIAQIGNRNKEIAIKKLMGNSNIAQLIQQIIETVSLTIFATVFAIGLAFLSEPFFDSQMNTKLDLIHCFNLPGIIVIIISVVLIGIVSGIAPAIVTRRFNPMEIVKGSFAFKTKKNYSRILISCQYIIAVVLLICTLIITRQSNYMRNFNIGINKDNLFWMEYSMSPDKKQPFRNELRTVPGVEEVSFSRGMLVDGGNNQSFQYNNRPVSFQEFIVDSTFFRIFGLKINNTGISYAKDGVWINQTAAKVLELEKNASAITFYDKKLPLLGIIDDFNFKSLYEKIQPVIIRQLNAPDSPWNTIIKINSSDPAGTIKKIKAIQAEFNKGEPVDSGFISSAIEQWYLKDVRRSKLMTAFALLSIILSTMGIFAMSLYYIQLKVKEIGIRKVNGARIYEVIVLLYKDFLVWVLSAFVAGVPVAYILMHSWLTNFAYKTNLSWHIFILSGGIIIGTTLVTLGWQCWKAATRNPVEALRYE